MANGLINLETDLKSLKYSSMPLGSQSPYVTKNIGQAPESQIGREIQSRIDDTSRIVQMLVDKPGLKYLANEALLQQVNIQDKLEKARDKGKTLGGAILQQLGSTAVNTVKIAASTLAQVPVNGTGTHFLKGFRTDTYLQPTNGNQASGFAQFFGAGGVEGAPLALKGQLIEGEVISNFPTGDTSQINSEFTTYSSGSTYTEAKTIPGEGNPASRLVNIPGSIDHQTVSGTLPDNGNDGIQKYTAQNTYTGKASEDHIERATAGRKIQPSPDPTENPYFGGVAQDFRTDGGGGFLSEELPYQETIEGSNTTQGEIGQALGESKLPRPTSLEKVKEAINSGSATIVSEFSSPTKVEDFRQGSTRVYSFDYNNSRIRRETRVNLGDQGKKKSSTFYTSYSNVDPEAIDKINALDISSTRLDGTAEARDLAKFYFEIITPEGSNFLHFRAFIDSIDDSYNADWQGSRYVGRGEEFYTYGGFSRDISVGFKISAATRSELKPLYKKMVYLASSTAPTYGGQGFMRGTLARITIGSYITQIPGVLTSVKYNLIDGMPWEIAMQNPEGGTDDDVQELPTGLQCNISFKAIHDFAPVTGLKHYMTSPNPRNGAQRFF